MAIQRRKIRVTRGDMERLQRVIEARRGVYRPDEPNLDALEEELERAEVVEARDLPADVVTMGSTVRVRDAASGEEKVYTIVFPMEARPAEGRISVLAPIGTALLGYRAGDDIEWTVPGGVRSFEVVAVLHQPEAARARSGAAAAVAAR